MFECCVVDVVIYFSTGICFLRHFSQTHQNHQNPKLQTMFEEQTSKGKQQATSNKQQTALPTNLFSLLQLVDKVEKRFVKSFNMISRISLLVVAILAALSTSAEAFTISHSSICANTHSSSQLEMAAGSGRSSPISGRDRSKRQERVGHVVRTELASIIQMGYQIKRGQGFIDDDLRRRINVISADVSPDLRQARITVSIMKQSRKAAMESVELDLEEDLDGEEEDSDEEEEEDFDEEGDEEFDEEEEFDDEYDEDERDPKQVFTMSKNGDSVVDRRRAYSWLVKNTKQIRHALSQRLKHMKSIPDLTFVQADVGAAVDVMKLIEKVSQGDYKRETLGVFGADDDNLPDNMYLESELEGDGWIDDDFEDFDEEDYDDKDEDEEETKK